MSCSNNASRPSDVIVKVPELFGFARPNVPSLAPTSAGTGGGSRFASAAPFNFRSQSKSSGVRFESITLTFDMGGRQTAQLFGCPLDGGVRRALTHFLPRLL